MMDGSLKADAKTPADYDYNVAITRRVAEMAHWVGASVEGELGVLGSLENGDGEAEDGHGAEGELVARPAPDRSGPGGGFRPADRGRRARDRHGHQPRRLQVHPQADRRHPRHARDRGDPRKLPDTHLVMHGSSSVPQDAAGSDQRERRRDAADLGRAGRGDPARHPPRRAQGEHRHRLPDGDDRHVPQGRDRRTAPSSTRGSS